MRAKTKPMQLCRIGFVLFFASIFSGALSARTNVPVADCQARAGEFQQTPGANEQIIVLENQSSCALWIEIEERGVELDIVESAKQIEISLQIVLPLRLGLFGAQLKPGEKISISHSSSNSQKINFGWRSDEQTTKIARIKLITDLALLSKQVEAMSADAKGADLDQKIAAYLKNPSNEFASAYIEHLHAQLIYRRGESAKAGDFFSKAKTKWLKFGDRRRAVAAEVGAVDSLLYQSANQEVLQKTPSTLVRAFGYYDLRLFGARCSAFYALSKVQQAMYCMDQTLSGFSQLGETFEVWVNQIEVLRWALGDGDLTRAQKFAALATRPPNLPSIPLRDYHWSMGRAFYFAAQFASNSADFAQAILYLNQSADHFSQASDQRWLASVNLQLARNFNQLGLLNEAYRACTEALQQINAKDAPTRVAAALLTLAELDRSRGAIDRARQWARRAQKIYSILKLPVDYDAARFTEWRLDLESIKIDSASRSHSKMKTKRTTNDANSKTDTDASALNWGKIELREPYRARGQLLHAALAIEKKEIDLAMQLLDSIDKDKLSIEWRFYFNEQRAKVHDSRAQLVQAEQIRRQSVVEILALATNTDNAVLRLILMQKTAAFRAQTLDQLLGRVRQQKPNFPIKMSAEDNQGILWWAWLPSQQFARAVSNKNNNQEHSRYDAVLARQLEGSSNEVNNTKAIMSVLLSAGESVSQSKFATPISNAEKGAAYLVLAEGEKYLGIFYLSGKTWQLIDVVERAQINRLATTIAKLTHTPHSQLQSIENESIALSKLILPKLPFNLLPTTLRVADSPMARKIIWPLMRWPGHDLALVEQSAVSILSLAEDAPSGKNASINAAMISIKIDQPLAQFKALPMATDEAKNFASLLPKRTHQSIEGESLTRAAIIGAFDQPEAWVHIASHGKTMPARFGFSGIILPATKAQNQIDFLGWTELVRRGVQSDLVILNACELAQSFGEMEDEQLDFARALSSAGARRVIAARWPISDTATTVWVPNFYQELKNAPIQSAVALQAAQRAVKSTRHFRHPFYWAGWVHLERMHVNNLAK